MTEELSQQLITIGVDLDEVMERFMGNEALLLRFLKQFPEDKNYKLLEKALSEKDVSAAFAACHTLKGVTGNLSLKKLYDQVCVQVEFLREGNLELGISVMPMVKRTYEEVCDAIVSLLL